MKNGDFLEFVSKIPDKVVKKLMRKFPSCEKYISYINEAELKLNGQRFRRSVVAITPNFLILFSKGPITHEHLLTSNILVIEKMVLSGKEEDGLLVEVGRHRLRILGEFFVGMARVLYRNFIILTTGLSKSFRKGLLIEDEDVYPALEVGLSPSQVFQNYYLNECKMEHEEYNHNVVNTIYKKLSCFDFSFDLSFFSLLRKRVAALNAVSYLPYFNYIFCRVAVDFDVLDTLPLFLYRGRNIRGVNIDLRGSTANGKRISEYLINNQYNEIYEWSIYNGKVRNLDQFLESFTYTHTHVRIINFNNLRLNETHLVTLLQSFRKSQYFWKIHSLSLAYAKFTEKAISAFEQYISKLKEVESYYLKKIDISGLGRGHREIIHILIRSNQSIEELRIADIELNQNDCRVLKLFVSSMPKLKLLDLSGCNFSAKTLLGFIEITKKRPDRSPFDLRISNLRSREHEIMKLFTQLLEKRPQNICSFIDLSYNVLSEKNARILIDTLSSLKRFTELDLSGIFSHEYTNIGEELAKLLTSYPIKKLVIRGDSGYRLRDEAIPIIDELKKCESITYFDISYNKIGNKGIKALTSSLSRNSSLNTIMFDGSECNDFNALEKLINSIRARGQSFWCQFPYDDVSAIVSDFKSSERDVALDEFIQMESDLSSSLSYNRNFCAEEFTNTRYCVDKCMIDVINSSYDSIMQIPNMSSVDTFSCSSRLFRVPFPNQRSMSHDLEEEEIENPVSSLYVTPYLNYKVVCEPYYTEKIFDKVHQRKDQKDAAQKDKRNAGSAANANETLLDSIKMARIRYNRLSCDLEIDSDYLLRFPESSYVEDPEPRAETASTGYDNQLESRYGIVYEKQDETGPRLKVPRGLDERKRTIDFSTSDDTEYSVLRTRVPIQQVSYGSKFSSSGDEGQQEHVDMVEYKVYDESSEGIPLNKEILNISGPVKRMNDIDVADDSDASELAKRVYLTSPGRGKKDDQDQQGGRWFSGQFEKMRSFYMHSSSDDRDG